MKKISILSITLLVFIIMSFPVSSKIKDVKVKPGGMSTYSSILVGKLSFDKTQWKDLGYKSQEEWSQAIDTTEMAFQDSVKKELSKKTVTFVKNTVNAELEITFSETKFDRGYGFGVGPWGAITTTMTVKEIKTGNVLFQGVLNARKNNEFSIDKQLQKTAEGIARDLPDILKK